MTKALEEKEKKAKSNAVRTSEKTRKIAITGLMAALCYVVFTFLKIPIPLPGGDTVALHLGNAFCVLAALLLGGGYGGLAGAIGMTLADIMDPVYISSAPKTLVLKFMIGWITGLVAHKFAKISADHPPAYLLRWSLLSSLAGLFFNVIADPVVGYFYKTYLLGIPQEASRIIAVWSAGVTAINAAAGTLVAVLLYQALRPILRSAGLFFRIS